MGNTKREIPHKIPQPMLCNIQYPISIYFWLLLTIVDLLYVYIYIPMFCLILFTLCATSFFHIISTKCSRGSGFCTLKWNSEVRLLSLGHFISFYGSRVTFTISFPKHMFFHLYNQ